MGDGLEFDPWPPGGAKEPAASQRELLLEALSGLTRVQFAELVFLMDIPEHFLPPGAQTEKAIDLINMVEQQRRLGELEERLKKYTGGAAPPVIPSEPPAAPLRLPPPPWSFRELGPSLSQAFAQLPQRSLAAPITAIAIAVVAGLVAVLWPAESQVADGPGALTAGIVDFAMGATWRDSPEATGRLVTDGVITGPLDQKPMLELTRVYDAHATDAGDLGLGWRLFQVYGLKRGEETEQINDHLTAPSSLTLINQIAGSEARLTLARRPIRYVGPGLPPWKELTPQTNNGAFLSDGRVNEIEFAADMSLSVVLIGDARWMLQHDPRNGRVLALQTIPRGLVVKDRASDGTPSSIAVDDALDPATFELQADDTQVVLRPRTTGRWDKILTNKEGTIAYLDDRWGNRLYYQPLGKFFMLDLSTKPAAMTRSGSGVLFTYDSYGRIQAADLGTAGRVSYEYDASGRLAAVVDAHGQRRQYRYGSGSAPVAYASTHALPIRLSLAGLAAVFLAIGAWKLRRSGQPRERS
jgi:RHS repeat protein